MTKSSTNLRHHLISVTPRPSAPLVIRTDHKPGTYDAVHSPYVISFDWELRSATKDEAHVLEDLGELPLTKLGHITGAFIDAEGLYNDEGDEAGEADGIDGHLRTVATLLSAPEGPLDEWNADPLQTVLFIDEMHLDEDVRDDTLEDRLMAELKHLSRHYFRRFPDLIAYLNPLEHTSLAGLEERKRTLRTFTRNGFVRMGKTQLYLK